MNNETINQHNARHFVEWDRWLEAGHATAVVVIGIGHDHTKGTVQVLTADGISDKVAACHVGQAFHELLRRIAAEKATVLQFPAERRAAG